MSKAEERKARKEKKKKKKEEKAVRMSEQSRAILETANTRQPKAASFPLGADKVPRSNTPTKNTSPKSIAPNDYEMSWCISRSDGVGEWSWKEARAWTEAEYQEEISKLNQYAGQKWHRVTNDYKTKAKGGKQVPLNHSQEVSSLCSEARGRWEELELYEYDTAFRFRVGGTKRIWGFVLQGHFYLVWYERKHNIYPVG